MLSTNAADLVAVSVAGHIAHPGFPGLPAEPYRLAADGTPFLLPTYGGIVYNVSVGDPAFGWFADCIHPGVSIRQADDMKNRGLNVYACLGNTARVMTGAAAGATGVVTGKSGRFSEQVICHFPKQDRLRMAVGDQIVIRAEGVGMALTDHPAVRLKGLSAALLGKMPLREGQGRLDVGVTASIPPHLIGAGLDRLRLGDIVALEDTDSRMNHGYLRGAMAIGVVCATDGPRAGYGPGIALIMTAPGGELGSYPDPGANIADLLGLIP
jgi:hypothetical protein